jgi:hypothetical protein
MAPRSSSPPTVFVIWFEGENNNAYVDSTSIGRCRGYTPLVSRRKTRPVSSSDVAHMMKEVVQSAFGW